MPKRERIEHRYVQRAETLLQHLLQCLCMWPRCPATIAPLTLGKIPHSDPTHPFELARLCQLHQLALKAMWAATGFLKDENRPVQIEFPGRSHCRQQI